MKQAIGDQAAIAFAVGFYKALGAGRSIEKAYEFGCAEILLQGIPEHLTPVPYEKKKVNPRENEENLYQKIPIYILPAQSDSIEDKVQLENPNDESSSEARIDSSPSSPSRTQTTIGRCLQSLPGHLGTVRAVAFSSDGQILASGSVDKTIKTWNPETGELLRTFSGHSSAVHSLTNTPDAQIIASGSFDGEINLWQLSTAELISTLARNLGAVTSVAVSPNGQLLASGSTDKTIRIWNLSTKQLIRTLAGHSGGVNCVGFSPDDQTIASGGQDKKIKIWNLHNGKPIRTFTGHSGGVNCIVFSPDGKSFASGSFDKTIKIWNLDTEKLLNTLTSSRLDVVHSLAFSPNGLMLVSGDNDKKIKIWSLRSGKVYRNLEGHSGWVSSIAINPDGKTLSSGSADRTVKIWCLSSIPDFGIKPPLARDSINCVRTEISSEPFTNNNDLLFEEALKIAGTAWLATQRTRLKGDQIAVLRAAWYKKNYDQIDHETNYSAEYLRKNVSSKFWSLLSAALSEKVNKQNFRSVIKKRLSATDAEKDS